MPEIMTEQKRHLMTYRVLRYTPNLLRDEWVNIGVLLHDPEQKVLRARLIAEPGELARVRRLHPQADEGLLRALPGDFDAQLAVPAPGMEEFLKKLEDTLSNVVQLGPQKGLLAEDFEIELERLYHNHVAPPARAGGAAWVENTRSWIRSHITDAFRRRRILQRMEKGVRVDKFTEPGDPFHFDYGYRVNGTRGFVQSLSLARDPAQAKILVYTAERIRQRLQSTAEFAAEFVAVTEAVPRAEERRHQFVARLLEEQRVRIVPVGALDAYAEELRMRLN